MEDVLKHFSNLPGYELEKSYMTWLANNVPDSNCESQDMGIGPSRSFLEGKNVLLQQSALFLQHIYQKIGYQLFYFLWRWGPNMLS